MGCTVTDNACLMKSTGGKSGTNLSKMLPRGCFPEKADTKGKRGAFHLFKTDEARVQQYQHSNMMLTPERV